MIDCFSRYAWAAGLREKTLHECTSKLDGIISSMVFTPRVFTSDAGLEFSISFGGELYNLLIEKFKVVVINDVSLHFLRWLFINQKEKKKVL